MLSIRVRRASVRQVWNALEARSSAHAESRVFLCRLLSGLQSVRGQEEVERRLNLVDGTQKACDGGPNGGLI